MEQPSLKVELIDGLQVIRCRKEDLSWDEGKALAICIPDFRGQTGDPLRNVVYIEWFDEKLQIRVYDGREESSDALTLKPDPKHGSGRFITPTVKNILLNLEKAIKKDF